MTHWRRAIMTVLGRCPADAHEESCQAVCLVHRERGAADVFQVHSNMTVSGLETVAKADISDPEKCKEAAEKQLKRKGIDVVCFVECNGSTEFMTGSRDACMQSLKPQKGSTTYVIPDPSASSALRMMKAVQGEGMPTLRNPFVHGNLFLMLTIDFPESLTASAQAALRNHLPPPKNSCAPGAASCKRRLKRVWSCVCAGVQTQDHEVHGLVDMDPIVSAQDNAVNMGGGQEAYDEDEAHGNGGGAQRVQCAQQ
mmetsp:Transcript_3464/g.8580  ORF Transcript_3464/g.8580 Transcript_3464/m.8580 type:complete len:254 (+) Transcript_3464:979-1740(+)